MLANVLNKWQTQVELVGLDIGTASVKLVRLLKGAKGYTATLAVKEEIDNAAEKEKRQAAVTAAVKRCFDKAGVSGRNVVCGLEGSQVVVRGFKFPPLPDVAIDQAVQFEARQVCPFDDKQSVLDYQLIEVPDLTPEEKDAAAVRRHGLMVVSTKEAVTEKTSIIAAAGGRTILVDAGALALINGLTELQSLEAASTVAAIDVGATYTHVVIYGKDGLPFVRDLNIAGGDIIRSISDNADIPPQQVRQALCGEQVDAEITNKVLLAMNDAIRPLAAAVNETLRFYAIQEKGAGVEKMYLCGGFSLVDAFVEFLTDAVSVEVELFNPFETIHCDAGKEGNEQLKSCGAAWATAAGLAMRTI